MREGDRAGSIDKLTGYRRVTINGRHTQTNRLIWLYMTGKEPDGLIDHKDLDRGNDRWNNLREATHSQNKANGPRYRNNTSGLKGVSLHKSGGFVARIGINGSVVYLGYYDCPAAAHFSYIIAADKHYHQFMRSS
jgi:hypothetical protein